jgi:hypothetical protein
MPHGVGTYGSKKGRPPSKKKKSVKAMGGGYMSAKGNAKSSMKKDEDSEDKKGKRMMAMGGGYMHKRKKTSRKK